MTRGMRWRIITLQAILVLVLGFGAGFLYYQAGFVNSMVHDQLAAQRITFPDKSQAVPGGALDPKEFPELQQYAGQRVDSGDKAYAFAQYFIGRHLKTVANGKTYAEVSAASRANPNDPTLRAQADTLFRGEMLRTALLNAWGWSQLAKYTMGAALALAVAALGVLAALIYEVVFARTEEVERPRVTTAPARAT